MLSNGFNEDDTDGVVIKIPLMIININPQLKAELVKLAELMESDGMLSRYHPDIRRSVYEIQNMDEKKSIIEDREAQKRSSEIAMQKRRDDILSGRILETEWKRKSMPSFNGENIVFEHNDPDKATDYVDSDQVISKKGNQKTSARELVFDQFKNKSINLIKTCESNTFMYLKRAIENADSPIDFDDVIRLNTLTAGYNWNLTLNCEILCIKKVTRSSGNQYNYMSLQVIKNGSGYAYLDLNNHIVPLDEYDFIGREFRIKIKS